MLPLSWSGSGGPLLDGYHRAIEQLNDGQYKEAIAFFAANEEYEQSRAYLRLCEGEAFWVGEWQDEEGNTLEIALDTEKRIGLLKSGADEYYPGRLYATVSINGEMATPPHDPDFIPDEPLHYYPNACAITIIGFGQSTMDGAGEVAWMRENNEGGIDVSCAGRIYHMTKSE